VTASEHVRLLGVMISSDLSLEKHVDTVCSKCFFHPSIYVFISRKCPHEKSMLKNDNAKWNTE